MLKQQAAIQAELDQRRIVGLLWVYFALLIGEGALRKWVLPGWSDALLVARDPIAVGILFLAFAGQDCGFPVIDCADVHAEAIYRKSVGEA